MNKETTSNHKKLKTKKSKLKTYQIWEEGFLISGMEGIPANASFIGTAQGKDFVDACKRYFKNDSTFRITEGGTPVRWGCRLFSNERDARHSFG